MSGRSALRSATTAILTGEVAGTTSGANMAFHDIQMESITGEQIDFAQFEGEFVLAVNVASF